MERIDGTRLIVSSAPESLDAAIVIPSYREGFDIIDCLRSIAEQKRPDQFTFAVFVVINNPPHEAPEAYQSNLTTYTLLQALRSKQHITLQSSSVPDNERRASMEKAISIIQKSDLNINIIDIFSGEYAHNGNNVGFAREVGSQTALRYLKTADRSLLISTDADTRLDPQFLYAARACFSAFPDIDALGGQIIADIAGVDAASKEAYRDYTVYNNALYGVRELSKYMRNQTDEGNIHDKELAASYLCGAATVLTREAFITVGGYASVAGGEDTRIGVELSRKGRVVRDARYAPGIVVYTSARVSDRADRGFGQTLAEWNSVPFSKHRVTDFPYEEAASRLLYALYDIHASDAPPEAQQERVDDACKRHGLNEAECAGIWDAYTEGVRMDNLFANTFLLGEIRGAFRRERFTVPMSTFVAHAEDRCEEYSAAMEKQHQPAHAAASHHVSWRDFKHKNADIIATSQNEDDMLRARLSVCAAFAQLHGVLV